MKERQSSAANGIVMLLVVIGVFAFSIYLFVTTDDLPRDQVAGRIVAAVVTLLVGLVMCPGFFIVAPNFGAVLQLFGKYVGTVRKAGLHWANPLYTAKKVSLRVRNFETSHLKVNDHMGNPIEIATVVVWRVVDTAEAVFQVDDYNHYVHVQSEAALRNMATNYAYDAHEEGEKSLRGNTTEVAAHLKDEIQERLQVAGLEIIEARISHLAYAPEIAAVMLQRQQASAIIAARQKIVEGAVGMVEMALDLLSKKNVVDFDSERRAAMVSNLLVVLCGERAAQPVLNTGTIHH